MSLQIYGIARTRAFRALWVAKELGIDYEHLPIEIGDAGARTPEFLAINPNGRLLKNGHPARFRVVLANETDAPQEGFLALEVVGNLSTLYGLPRERVLLAPREKRSIVVSWTYPGDAVYPGLPNGSLNVPGPSWGHEIRAAWLERAVGLGGGLRVRLPHDTLAGIFAGLDSDGALLLDAASGRRRIEAGEVFPAAPVP